MLEAETEHLLLATSCERKKRAGAQGRSWYLSACDVAASWARGGHGDGPERQGVDQQGLASSSVIAKWLQEQRGPRTAKLVMMYVKQN